MQNITRYQMKALLVLTIINLVVLSAIVVWGPMLIRKEAQAALHEREKKIVGKLRPAAMKIRADTAQEGDVETLEDVIETFLGVLKALAPPDELKERQQ